MLDKIPYTTFAELFLFNP